MDSRRRLYHARIDSHLTLEQIGVRTALSPSVLRHIDEGRFELLPSGLYARSYIRTFASAVGLDPETTLALVEHLLPGAPDPLPALNAMRPDPAEWAGQLAQRLLSALGALVMTCITRITATTRAALVRLAAARAGAQDWVAPRLDALRSAGPWNRDASAADLRRRAGHLRAIVLPPVGRLQTSPRVARCSAAAIDAVLLLVVDGFLVLLVSWSSGIPGERLVREAGWALGAFCAIPVALYFVLFGGIAGSTLGRYVCSLVTRPDDRHIARPDHPLTLPEILRRAVKP